MSTQSSTIKLQTTGTDSTRAMFASVQQSLEQTRSKVAQVAQPAVPAQRQFGAMATSIQQIGTVGTASAMGAVGAVKTLTEQIEALGVTINTAIPVALAISAVVLAVSAAVKAVKKAQDEAKESAEELKKSTIEGAKNVLAAYDRQAQKLKDIRAAQDELNRARREGEAIGDESWVTRIETEGLKAMLGATSQEERDRIAKQIAEAVAEEKYKSSKRIAQDAADDALKALRRNIKDIEELQRKQDAGRKTLELMRNSGVDIHSSEYKAQVEAVRKTAAEIESAQRRRAALQQQYANAQAKQRLLEEQRQKALLEGQLAAAKQLEAAAKRVAETKARLAEMEAKREKDLAAARQKAIDDTNAWYTQMMGRQSSDNMLGARVMDKAEVARMQALTGKGGSFRRTKEGWVMVGGGLSKEDAHRVKTEHWQREMLRLTREINDRYDEQEAGLVTEEI